MKVWLAFDQCVESCPISCGYWSLSVGIVFLVTLTLVNKDMRHRERVSTITREEALLT